MEKTLTIHIGDDLATLKGSEYSLCLAKQFQDFPFSIVWHADSNFNSKNVFKWTPDYQIFATNSFQSGQQVFESVDAVDIGLGQQSTLNQFGTLSTPSSIDLPGAFRMVNNYGDIFPGVKQQATGFDRKPTCLPNFVTTEPAMKGTIDLTPTESIMVWFQGGMQAGTMFDQFLAPAIGPPPSSLFQGFGSLSKASKGTRTFACIVDFSQVDEHAVKYEDGGWITQS